MQRRFHIHGTNVDLVWDDPTVGRVVEGLFGHFESSSGEEEAARPHARLRFSTSEAPMSVPACAAEEDRYVEGIGAWRAGRQIFLRGGDSTVRLEPALGEGLGQVSPDLMARPDAPHEKLVGLLALSLFILLRPHGLYPLHAAALARERADRREGAGVLLVADSGCGKSTMAYSLVRQGWNYLSDDSILLRPNARATAGTQATADTQAAGEDPKAIEDGQAIEALSFRRNFGLVQEAEDDFPELPSVWENKRVGAGEKRNVPIRALYPAQAAERFTPDVLLFPKIVDQPESRLLAISKSEVFFTLVRQSAVVTLEPGRASDHMEVLKRLIGQTTQYRLLAGRDLKDDPPRVAALLKRVLPDGEKNIRETTYSSSLTISQRTA